MFQIRREEIGITEPETVGFGSRPCFEWMPVETMYGNDTMLSGQV